MSLPTLSEPPDLSQFSDTVALIGAGKMGAAMLDGWLRLGLDPARITVTEPQPTPSVAALAVRGLRLNADARSICPDAIMLAVKPQTAHEVLGNLAQLVAPSTVVISIMAGRTIASIAAALPHGTAIIRAMPNTPAAIGRGITVAVPNARVTSGQRALAHALLAATGTVEWIRDEGLIDAVTAVSGSGPAYVFLLAECLARAGTAAGLPSELAARLARATVAGSGELLHCSSVDAAELRCNVTSPGGTTAAALEVLMAADGLESLMQRAVAAATARSRALAG